MATNYFWKIWLKPNPFAPKEDASYVAQVSSGKKTLRNTDIAQLITAEGSEIKYDTLLSILNQSDRIVRKHLKMGHSVQTGVCRYSPRILGVWTGILAKFDSARHKITLNIVPSAEMRADLGDVGVEVLGIRDSSAWVGLVTDSATGLSDGHITSGENVMIRGRQIKIAPEGENGLGIAFIGEDGTVVPVTRRLTQNGPKQLIARVPDLPAGKYSLRIITRYSAGSNLLKEPRIIEYDLKLTVV
ncbi:MAG: DNA-binding domain-containing protein [Breznakibacter sp.]